MAKEWSKPFRKDEKHLNLVKFLNATQFVNLIQFFRLILLFKQTQLKLPLFFEPLFQTLIGLSC